MIFNIRSKVRIKAEKKLKFAFILGSIAALFALIGIYIENYLGYDKSPIIAIQWAMYSLQSFTFYLMFEDLLNTKIKVSRLVIFSSVLGITLIGSILKLFNDLNGLMRLFYDISYSGLGMITFIFGFYYLFKSYKISKEQAALIQLIGSAFLIFGFAIGTLISPIIADILNVNFINFTVADSFKIIGILLFVVLYVINPIYLLRLPVQVRSILVYSKNGISLLKINVTTKGLENDLNINEDMISALASAITAFAKEALGSNADLDLLMTKDKVVRFKIDNISLALISDEETEVLVDSLDYFSLLLNTAFTDNINFTDHGVETDKIIELLNIAFPYLVVQSFSK